MLDSIALRPNYSATVSLHLVVGGKVYSLWATGPDEITLRSPIELPPCDAEVVATVDGREHRRPVRLPDGAVPFETCVRVCPRE